MEDRPHSRDREPNPLNWYTADQLIEEHGIFPSRQAVARHVRRGALQASRVGRQLVIHKRELERFLRAQEVTP